MLLLILEAALRSVLMAAAVWAVIRVLRVRAVLAQKVAWVLVLAAAAVMPLVMRAPLLAANSALRIPLGGMTPRQLFACLQMLLPQSPAQPAAQTAAIDANADAGTSSPASMMQGNSASDSPHALLVPTPKLKSRIVARPPRNESTVRVFNLPLIPMNVSLKLPVALPARVGFWTTSRIRLVVILLYAAVVAGLLLRTAFGLAVAGRLLQRSRKIHILSGTGKAMHVRSSPDLATPVTIGSTILLPSDYARWNAEKLRVVLAHEGSHVRQRDFYLQLAATIHAAIFWFSPLGWWLKRTLSDLGEALSDRAALAQADDAASYAQVLLEFAAAPHRAPLAGVAMARRSNLSTRIERILTDSRSQLAFLGGRRHAILAAVLVPAAVVAAVVSFRIVPAVQAASTNLSGTIVKGLIAKSAGVSCDQGGSVELGKAISFEKVQSSDAVATSIAAQAPIQQAVPTPTAAPDVTPNPPTVGVEAPQAPEAPEAPEDVDQDSDDSSTHTHSHTHSGSHTISHSGDDGDSFSIVHRNGNGTINWNGDSRSDMMRSIKGKDLPNDFILFRHDGKSYVVTDPGVLAQADAMFREDPALKARQKSLEDQQKVLEKQMEEKNEDRVKIDVNTPEFRKQMAQLNAQIAKLQSDEFHKRLADINKQVNQEELGKLQEQMGNIQEQIGELQGQIGEQMGKFGEEQGKLGEQMGKLGEQMGRIGEEQGRKAEEATRKMQSVLDQARRDGKAKPVE